VSATNRDLREWVSAGRFRQDLFFRLDGISIHIPPLRERTLEIPPLSIAFAKEACAGMGKPPLAISHDAMARLVHHRWPGNIRELRNVIARSVLLCTSDTLRPADLRFEGVGRPAATPGPSLTDLPPVPPASAPASRRSLEAGSEERTILDALERAAGNQTRAAKMLGMSRRTLLKRLDAMDVPRPRKRDDE
jgi:DNA-binding NtrC family response regulator